MLTSQNAGILSEFFATLPTGLGLRLGMLQQVPNTPDFKMLVKAGAANILTGEICMFDTTTYTVIKTTGVNSVLCGVQDNVGGTVTAANFFWLSVRGNVTPIVLTGRSAGDPLAPSATAGALDLAAATSLVFPRVECRATSGASVPVACFIH